MSPKYTVEAADGFYIARNGEGVLDLADSQDYEFAKFVCSALNQAAQQSVYLTAFGAGGRGQIPLQSSFIADDPSAKHGGR